MLVVIAGGGGGGSPSSGVANPDTATVTALQHGLCSYRHSSANPATDGVAGMLLVVCLVDRRTQLIFIELDFHRAVHSTGIQPYINHQIYYI